MLSPLRTACFLVVSGVLFGALAGACAAFPAYDLALSNEAGPGAGPPVDASGLTPQCMPPALPIDTSGASVVVGDGTAASCTETQLREKLASVPTGGVLGFACGAAPVTITVTATLVLDPTRSVTIDGGQQITLDGGNAVRIMSWSQGGFRANSQVLALRGLAFTRGRGVATAADTELASGSGGAVFFADGVLLVDQCSFHENAAPDSGGNVAGGAVYVSGAKSVQITSSSFYANTAASGGGVGSNNSDLAVFDSVFRLNEARGTGGPMQLGGQGGGIFMQGGSDGSARFCGMRAIQNRAEAGAGLFRQHYGTDQPATVVEYGLFQKNSTTTSYGTALHLGQVTATLSALSVIDNTSDSGGVAVSLQSSVIDVVNTTIARNRGSFAGLGLDGTGKIRNCTFVANHATAFNAAINGATSGIAITNSIFAANVSDNAQPNINPTTCGGGVQNTPASPSSMTGGTGCLQVPGTSNLDPLCAPAVTVADPQLGELDETQSLPVYVPAASSPARLADTALCPDTDQLGHQRPSTGCTAGAVQ